jgi:hypothetical protein
VPNNGEVNLKCGVYRNLCCGEEIVIHEGAAFPDCSQHANLTTIWKPQMNESLTRQGLDQSRKLPSASRAGT